MELDTIKPVAWRVECRWVDPTKSGNEWRKYADYGTLKAAQSSQHRFANPGDIESRIIPLVNGEEVIDQLEAMSIANAKLVGALDMILETLKGGNVDDLLYIINEALAAYHRNTPPSASQQFGTDIWAGIV